MFRTSKYAYVYAKIFGLIAKSYIGENLADLVKSRKTRDLLEILLPEAKEEIGEHRLTVELQKRIIERNIQTIMYILDLMPDANPVLVHLLQSYEYQNLKSITRCLAVDGKEQPVLWNLKHYSRFGFRTGAPLADQIKRTKFSWILEALKEDPVYRVENKIDREYYLRLWELAANLPQADKRGIRVLLKQEVELQNVVWALRLRFFQDMDKEEVKDLFIPLPSRAHLDKILEAFDMAADDVSAWRNWKYGWLLEDQVQNDHFEIDPVKAEEAALYALNTRIWKYFHRDPFTLTPFYCFVKIKEMEANLLKTVVEGFRMNVPTEEILSLIGF